jgi:hypothetical protein
MSADADAALRSVRGADAVPSTTDDAQATLASSQSITGDIFL